MAKKSNKSRAELAASAKENKSSGRKRSSTKNNKTKSSKEIKTVEQNESSIPSRFFSALFFLCLFILFTVTLLLPKGALIVMISEFVHGMIGRAAFIVSIPVFLYIFLVHATSGKQPVAMRTMYLVLFVLLCGCVSHLTLTSASTDSLPDGNTISTLYTCGVNGTSGGALCGSIASITRYCCGPVISYILLIVGALLTLLAGMKITIASIVRAVQNRPRPQADEDEELEEDPDPATIVVNHIANKRNQYIEKRRQEKENRQLAFDLEDEDNHVESDKKQGKVKAITSQIDSDVDEPVAVSVDVLDIPEEPEPEIIPDVLKPKASNPSAMPELVIERQVIDPDPGLVPEDMFQEEPEPVPVPATPVKSAKKEKVTPKDTEESAKLVAEEIAQAATEKMEEYRFPPIDLLKYPGGPAADGTVEMRENTRRLDETLASFKIDAHIINVTRGPSVTRYEVELEKGVRLNKLTTAADDIALSLGATGVRIAAVPGKISVVGIEVPNENVTMVSLREVIDSKEFNKARSKSSFAVGKDIGGNCIVGNIAKLPHMLIAGTTGSGKSVCMNSIIVSLLYKASPQDVKLIMVDPKMVELGIYNDIPHLLIPVVTDPKKAAGSLQWAVTEMMRRYKAMKDVGVRDLESYNSIVSAEEEGTTLPQVVVIIDELADLMLVAAKEVEESICRIAQMGRAAGIHLIIATQRPSADVITGLMKANIPSRIAFAVASAMESRIILDTQGAEKLVGKGDMLYAPIGSGKPQRVQGCFVTDSEVEAVAEYVKSNFLTDYNQEVLEEIELKAAQTGTKNSGSSAPVEPAADELGGDELLPEAVEVILELGQASVSKLQRRLKLGYSRAARIVDELEEMGIVGPFVGSKPREILITKEQWAQMRGGKSTQMEFDDLADDNFTEPVPDDF